MGVFNQIIKTDEDGHIVSNIWIRWIHEGSLPARTYNEKIKNVLIGEFSNHCAKCLNLNGCHFPINNMPDQPLHPNCHCYKINIDKPMPNISASALLQ